MYFVLLSPKDKFPSTNPKERGLKLEYSLFSSWKTICRIRYL